MRIKILIYEPEVRNHEAINKCYLEIEGTDIIVVTTLEEIGKLSNMVDKCIFSLSDNEKEEVVLAEKISTNKNILVLKHENNMLGFGKFRPDLRYYWKSGIFKLTDPYTWEMGLKELNNIP